jgi:hypothetical protein
MTTRSQVRHFKTFEADPDPVLVLIVVLPVPVALSGSVFVSFPLHFSVSSPLSYRTPLCGWYQSGFVGFIAMLEAARCFHILHSAWYLFPAVHDTVGEEISSHLKPGGHLPQVMRAVCTPGGSPTLCS